jgi:hypothetical protein
MPDAHSEPEVPDGRVDHQQLYRELHFQASRTQIESTQINGAGEMREIKSCVEMQFLVRGARKKCAKWFEILEQGAAR